MSHLVGINSDSSDYSDAENTTTVQPSVALAELPTKPDLPLPVFGPLPRLGNNHTYHPAPDGNVPIFKPMSMPLSLTRLEIGDIKPKFSPKFRAKAYWTISIKGDAITATTTDRDGNSIITPIFEARFNLKKKSTFLKKLQKPWLEWYQAVQDVNYQNKTAYERAVQKAESSAEIKYATENHPDILPTDIEKRFNLDFFVLNQHVYWRAKGRNKLGNIFDSQKDFLAKAYAEEVKKGKWEKTSKRKRSDSSIAVSKEMWETMQEEVGSMREEMESMREETEKVKSLRDEMKGMRGKMRNMKEKIEELEAHILVNAVSQTMDKATVGHDMV
ncbi:MAG: hypothetical protein M1839_002162 [Geoglossum umbratile]|nr:MAG: hypothetical protein M1839_002162 [Geoglossum umbratile]